MIPQNREEPRISSVVLILTIKPNGHNRELVAIVRRMRFVVEDIAKPPPVAVRREDRPQCVRHLPFLREQGTRRHIIGLLLVERSDLEGGCENEETT